MEKVVVKTAVKTVLIILGIFIIVFAVFNIAFPQHMATMTESTGNYTLAVKYADLRYTYTKKCSDLSRCFDDSVLLGNDKLVVEYGEKLIDHKDYNDLCKEKNESYRGGFDYANRVNAKLALSYYNVDRKADAIRTAVRDYNPTKFAYGNPVMSLAARIISEKDAPVAEDLLNLLEGNGEEEFKNVKKCEPVADGDRTNLLEIKNALRNVIIQNAK